MGRLVSEASACLRAFGRAFVSAGCVLRIMGRARSLSEHADLVWGKDDSRSKSLRCAPLAALRARAPVLVCMGPCACARVCMCVCVCAYLRVNVWFCARMFVAVHTQRNAI